MTECEWPEPSLPIMTLGHITQTAEDMIQEGAGGSYSFRGQGDATWPLEPRLGRTVRGSGLTAKQVLKLESSMRQQFEAHAHLYLEPSVLAEDDFIAWWSLMQHHEAPTRLLDWTASPQVALYFAVVDEPDKDGAVWFFHSGALREMMKQQCSTYFDQIMPNIKKLEEECTLPDAPETLYTVQRIRHTSRMVAQQGMFTLCTQVLSDHGRIIANALRDKTASFGRWIIQRQDKNKLLFALRAANITASALFPGIDGIGRSLQDFVRIQPMVSRD